MRYVMMACVAMLIAFAAMAQPAVPPLTPSEEVLGTKLLQELQAGLQCNTQLISLRKQLEAAQKEIAELRKPAEPQK